MGLICMKSFVEDVGFEIKGLRAESNSPGHV
jgi:hypothetical protein